MLEPCNSNEFINFNGNGLFKKEIIEEKRESFLEDPNYEENVSNDSG